MQAARLLIVIVVAAVLGALFYRWYERERVPVAQEVSETRSEPQKVPVPRIHYPVPGPGALAESVEEAQEPLPSLEQSDPPLREAIAGLLPGWRLEELLILSNVIGRVVLMVDSLTHETLPLSSLPVRQAPGQFLVEDIPGGPIISPDNFRRYTPFVRLVEAVDAPKLVDLYLRYYPLFQQAYEDLGYANRYFNDRLVEVIDHLLATPEVEQPVPLVREVRYLFADPEFEALSAGRKLLVRIGPQNAAVLKAKLREIRNELIERPG